MAAPSVIAEPNALNVVEDAFRALTAGPASLSLDGRALEHGLPARALRVEELNKLLRDLGNAAGDVVWRELVTRSRAGDPAWVIACFGVALPALKTTAQRATRDLPADTAADVVARFLEALATVEVDRHSIAPRLIWTARKAANRARQRLTRAVPVNPHSEVLRSRAVTSLEAALPCDPGQVLADAVALGVLTQHEADVITVTRLSTTSPAELAERLGVRAAACTGSGSGPRRGCARRSWAVNFRQRASAPAGTGRADGLQGVSSKVTARWGSGRTWSGSHAQPITRVLEGGRPQPASSGRGLGSAARSVRSAA
ncbi:hypothetical protein ACQEU3_15110 [Spirillospora sp. CA-253888]